VPGISNIVSRFFGARGRSGRTLALLDLHAHTRGGHYGSWLRWFAGEFSPRFDEVCVVTPDPRLTRSLFQERDAAVPNVSFHQLPARLRKTFDLEALRGLDGARRRHLSAFVMWGYDLLDLRPPRKPSSIPWAALGGISWLRRGHGTPAAEMEGKLLELFRSTPSCRAFMQPDRYLNGVEKAIWIPDIENVVFPTRSTTRAERIRFHAGGRFCVGAFGILTGKRCLDELLRLARAQPDVRFVAAGRVVEESVSPELRPLLRDGSLGNLLVLPEFIPTEEELNDAIRATDAVFIDGAGYPVQSGIVCKAVHAGCCILTPRSNSWTCDFVLERGTGIVYESRADPIAEAWERWKSDGGEARSRAASEALRDPRDVAACFDDVTNELTREMDATTA
jgi:hypothetical protein